MFRMLAPLVLIVFLTPQAQQSVAATSAPNGASVLVVINQNSADSKAIGAYYARRRAVPQKNICTIDAVTDETIGRGAYDTQIAAPVRACLESRQLTESVLYIVTTLGVPLRVDGNGGRNADLASVDSELATLYMQIAGLQVTLQGPLRNPFFEAPADREFVHSRYPIYLVTRLAAYDRATVFRIIDDAQRAVNRGKIVIDATSAEPKPGNNWLLAAAKALPADRVVYDNTPSVLHGIEDVIAYASWGSNDAARKERFLQMRWLPGSLMTEFVSTNARTFQRPPAAWKTVGANWADSSTFYVGSPQTLTADYLQEGATNAAGHVYEPYLAMCPRPDLFLPAYLVQGRNLAESFYRSIPAVSWQNIVIGDPLCRLESH